MSSSNSNRLHHILSSQFVRGVLFSAFLISTMMSPEAKAQFGEVKVGDRVRITAPFVLEDKISGTITELDKSVLVVSVKDSSVYISGSMIQNLETSKGERRVIGRGALIGAVSGLVLTGMTSAVINNACGLGEDCVIANRDGEAFLNGAAIGLLMGITIGTTAGFFTKVDQWERVPFRIAMDAESVRTNFRESSVNPAISFRFSLNR